MGKLLQACGVLALLLWTGGGLAAWMLTREQIHLTVSDGSARGGDDGLAALEERVGSLAGDVRALAKALGDGLEALAAQLETSAAQRGEALTNEVAALRAAVQAQAARPFERDAIAALRDELALVRRGIEALHAAPAPAPAPEPEPAPEPALEPAPVAAEPAPAVEAPPPAQEAASKPAQRRGFLAFTLPSEDFRFDERRRWTLLPALSRVGFDAKSTLHDFTGVTSKLEGELWANLADPAADPAAKVRVDARSLDTGLADRNTAMGEHLSIQDHPWIEFELGAFTAESVDATAQTARGTARGQMTIRGVKRELAMAVRLSIDPSRRLVLEGEAPLKLSDFGVPVPSKLGVISMQDEVKVWVALRARCLPRDQQGR